MKPSSAKPAQRALPRFITHELRTSITIVKEGIANLHDGLLGPLSEKQARIVGITHKNVQRLSSLLSELLDTCQEDYKNQENFKIIPCNRDSIPRHDP